MNSIKRLGSRLGKGGLIALAAGATALATAAAYYYDGTVFRNTPSSAKFYDTSTYATAPSANKLYMDAADAPGGSTTQTFYFDAATNTYKNTTTLALSAFSCGTPSSMGPGAGTVVICEPTSTSGGSGGGAGGGSTPGNVFGGGSGGPIQSAGFIDPYGSAWNMTNPAVTSAGGTTLASGAQVKVQTTAASPKVVAYSVDLPDPNASGQNLTLTNVFFGCRPDLGNYGGCDGLMSFEYDTVAQSWRLVALVDARTGKAYVDEFAANNNFGSAAQIVSTMAYYQPGTSAPTNFPVVKVQNMGITLAAILAYWDWSKY